MNGTSWLRGGSLMLAIGAVAALVLHACASSEPANNSQVAAPHAAALANGGTTENATSTATTAPTTNPPAANVDDDPTYFPATKAGPGIVLSKPKIQSPPPQTPQLANPAPKNAQ